MASEERLYIDINGTPFRSIPALCMCTTNRTCVATLCKVSDQTSGYLYCVSNNYVDNGTLFNPQDGAQHPGRNLPCSHECYKAYVSFLRSKNHTHFLIAQRRFTNEHNRQH